MLRRSTSWGSSDPARRASRVSNRRRRHSETTSASGSFGDAGARHRGVDPARSARRKVLDRHFAGASNRNVLDHRVCSGVRTVSVHQRCGVSSGRPIQQLSGCPATSIQSLFKVQIPYLPGGTPPPATLQVVAHAFPTNANYACPLLSADIGVVLCRTCVDGGLLYINGTGDCTVATNVRGWTQVKRLFE